MREAIVGLPDDVQVVTHGIANPAVIAYARSKIVDLVRYAGEPVLHVRVKLAHAPDPAVHAAFRAQATLDLNGRPIRAEAAAATPTEAIDLLQDRLRRRMIRAARA
ncbi:MAG: hypothetical protein HOV79_26580 [Hamadaea sp.]|nr:hypothetical protein [Hamadaea sp.]